MLWLDLDDHDGHIEFQWPDYLYGYEYLRIELDGYCSRRMGLRSGTGLVSVELERDRVQIRFTPELARTLELAEQVEILFTIADEEFQELRKAIDECMGGWGDHELEGETGRSESPGLPD